MKTNFKKVVISIIIAMGSALLSLLLSQTSIVQQWQSQVNDIFYRTFQSEQHPDETVIIAIDQNSLNYMKEMAILWPWPRQIYSVITEYLHHCGTKTIAFDVILSSPDIERLNVNAQASDNAFAQEMKNCANVILASQMEDSTHSSTNPAILNFTKELHFEVDENIVKKYPRATLPIKKFQENMAHAGVVNFSTDRDGICRKLPLVFEYKGKIYPYMALASSMLYDNSNDVTWNNKTKCLQYDERNIPLDKDGNFNIYWYGPGGPGNTFAYESFANLLNSSVQWKRGQQPLIPCETFKDKAIFIGATAAGLLDLKPTPYSSVEPFPGVEIYATVFSNIVNSDYISDFPLLIWTLISLLLLTAIAFLWQTIKIWISAPITLICMVMPVIAAAYLFRSHLIFLPIVSTEIAIIFSVISILAEIYLTEGREKKLVKQVFNRYLHPAVVDTLTQNPEKIEMGGTEKKATVLFTDLEGFTGISENFTPEEIVLLLNKYFGKVEKIVFENNGMLDKYTGDGIMAVFGVPLETKFHARDACNAILSFIQLSQIEIEISGRSVRLITRVGVNSGSLIVGNIGSPNRMDFTAIGDTVNLSARLEGVNKQYGTRNLISETTYDYVKNDLICRELDFIRVKGREKPLRIYNVIGNINDIDDKTRELLSMHDEGLNVYRSGNFTKAQSFFEKLLEKFPDDPVGRAFQKRCVLLQDNRKLVDKDGIFNINVK